MEYELVEEEMKYELGQLVFYVHDNNICSSKVLARSVVENVKNDWRSDNDVQKEVWLPFGYNGIRYETCHGTRDEHQLHASREELLEAM